MLTVITNSVYCSFKRHFPFCPTRWETYLLFHRAYVRACEDGFADAITLNDLPNHVVLTMTEGSTHITNMTLWENNSSNNRTKLSSVRCVYKACWETGTWLQDYCHAGQHGSFSVSKGECWLKKSHNIRPVSFKSVRLTFKAVQGVVLYSSWQLDRYYNHFLCIKVYEWRSVSGKREKQENATAGGKLHENNGTIHQFLLVIQQLKWCEMPNIFILWKIGDMFRVYLFSHKKSA